MSQARSSPDWQVPRPVILGTGLTGFAISRALSGAGITHVLVGSRPGDTPRLGESLNPEGSLEIVRQFPDLTRFFFKKQQLAVFFGNNAMSFNTIQLGAAPSIYAAFGYPPTVQLLHVDRIGFDRALADAAIADSHCLYLDDRPSSVVYRPSADRIDGVQLAGGTMVAASYVFDATNQAGFVGRKIGITRTRVGEKRRVVFAHYRPSEKARDGSAPPWMEATALLRLEPRTDPMDGLAWCIPLGSYVSVGISVDAAKTQADPGLLLDWAERGYAARGLDARAAFPLRSEPVDSGYEHYTQARCYGRNWLLAGPSCCQIWFHSAAGVATGLLAARLAVDALAAPIQTGAFYQSYIDQVVASHAKLDWIVRDDPETVGADTVRQRAQAMIGGNVRRLVGYLGSTRVPAELAFGDAISRLYQSDRLMANPLCVETVPPGGQPSRVFAHSREM